jgi:integrase
MLIQGGRRILAKPVQKKEPITIDILKSIHDFYRLSENKSDLNSVRLFCMLIVGYSGFLRFNEIANLKVKDVKFCDLYMELCIQSSKTDVYRRGGAVTIAKAGGSLCPVFWMKHYFELAKLSSPEEYVFRAIRFFKSLNQYKLCEQNRPISYTRARELLLGILKTVGLDSTLFGLHSLRSGGASAAATNKVPDRLIKVHGRWKSDFSRDNYIKDSMENKLKVTRNLNLYQ